MTSAPIQFTALAPGFEKAVGVVLHTARLVFWSPPDVDCAGPWDPLNSGDHQPKLVVPGRMVAAVLNALNLGGLPLRHVNPRTGRESFSQLQDQEWPIPLELGRHPIQERIREIAVRIRGPELLDVRVIIGDPGKGADDLWVESMTTSGAFTVVWTLEEDLSPVAERLSPVEDELLSILSAGVAPPTHLQRSLS